VLAGLRGLGAALGSFGRVIISRLQDIGGTIADALHLGEAAGVEVSPAAVAHEWGEVSVASERQGTFAALGPWDTPSPAMYEESAIPFDKPIAYKVAVYGRDLATGRFTHQEYDITVSRPLSVTEALDEAQARLGQVGESPTVAIFSMKLIGASKRLGEEWRW